MVCCGQQVLTGGSSYLKMVPCTHARSQCVYATSQLVCMLDIQDVYFSRRRFTVLTTILNGPFVIMV